MVVTDKTQFFEIDPFCTPILFVLTLASDWALLYGNVAFSIIVLQLKNDTPAF